MKLKGYAVVQLILVIVFNVSLCLSQTIDNSGFINAKTIVPEFSVGGFFHVENGGRDIYNFNVGWRFHRGIVENANKIVFDDSGWELSNLPHGLELLPEEASGSINYQGEAWYRKRFEITQDLKGRKNFFHFEGIMGKSKIWINGELVAQNYSGYLPVIIDASDFLKYDSDENIITVWLDNSDDPEYPPGKPQKFLDFCYFGGIYRDVWFVSVDKLHITNPNYANKTASGGVFIHFEKLTDKSVTVVVQTEISNEYLSNQELYLETVIKNKKGKIVGKSKEKILIEPLTGKTTQQKILIKKPKLWHPDNPYLYDVVSSITINRSHIKDAVKTRIGIRKIEFKGKDGFYLNNKPFAGKLIGANRHQDFAYVGNALPNSTHWRDVKKLKDAGMNIIRTAHYPQDPAFMDACDELGIFFIEATPGWQFWNPDTIFRQRIYNDIRNIVRRDRNHACVLMWEPVLNETGYPDDFAIDVHNIVHEEYPFEGCYTVADKHARGHAYFDVLYSHPYQDIFWSKYIENTDENQQKYSIDYSSYDKCIFTREWGDCVDDWSSHNSPSRVHKSWGEAAQIVQANHYANPNYLYTSYNNLFLTPPQHVGGCLWHSFDHQRGYHPDPFYGGIMDAFRQPKYSYYMFQSQRNPKLKIDNVENGPMVFIANEMTPFSSSDITIYTNCDEVKVKVMGKGLGTKKVKNKSGIPYSLVIFENAYEFYQAKELFRERKIEEVEIIAEGIIDGKVAVISSRRPARRPTEIFLKADYSGCSFVADGSDFITVVAYMTDEDGNIKRLNNQHIKFEISGEGEIIGDVLIGANPKKIEWGAAPVLIRSTTKPGNIQIQASVSHIGINTPISSKLVIESIKPKYSLMFSEEKKYNNSKFINEIRNKKINSDLKIEIEEVGKKQQEFE